MYVADTHAFVWFLTEDEKLGKNAREIFLSADKGDTIVIIPSIVLLETLHICEKHKAELLFRNVLEKIRNTFNYPIYPLDLRIISECQDLKQIPELHDRVIVATANLLDAKVITKDEEIKKSGIVDSIW